MKNIPDSMAYRKTESYEKIKRAYEQAETKELPFVISDVNYWISDDSPADYFDSFSTMTGYQEKKISRHFSNLKDDYIPLLFPWYGTGVVPSAIGCGYVFRKGHEPAIEGTVIKEPEDIKKLEMPDPYKDGLMPKVLGCIDYMRENSDLPVSFSDPQGPLNIAICLCGVQNLFIWMFEYPEYVHMIMDYCTEVFIEWIRVQKKHAGQPLDGGAFPHAMVLPEGFGGVWLSDDDCTVMSPELYKEFVVPYNSRVFTTFGGGTLHFCGTAEHQLENFLGTKGLTGINNFCMGNFRQVAKMQELFENRLALMVCDFTPLDMEKYYRQLIDVLKFKGTILGTFISPDFALVDGKYESTPRDRDFIINETYRVITKYLHEKQK